MGDSFKEPTHLGGFPRQLKILYECGFGSRMGGTGLTRHTVTLSWFTTGIWKSKWAQWRQLVRSGNFGKLAIQVMQARKIWR